MSHKVKTSTYLLNPDLQVTEPFPGYKGVPADANGRFLNLHEPFSTSLSMLLKWQLFSRNPLKEQKKRDNRKLTHERCDEFFQSTYDGIIWLGHASFLIRISGITFITDPVFFESPFLKRQFPLPFRPESIERIDYILLSHDHRDHCDKRTLRFIARKCPKVQVFTGLKLGELAQKWLPRQTITEAGWYQTFPQTDLNGIEITYVPARHWGKRWLRDERKRLWGGFYIKSPAISLYFMGDSGYGSHFSEISRTLGSPDLSFLGVGAFRPEWFMHSSHISPTDAIKAAQDLQTGNFIPMHFGTLDLSDEPPLEPMDILKQKQPESLHICIPGRFYPLRIFKRAI
ncbi:MAG: MBL fold metallo-hydrolase [Balneolales bacterium]|nr:MBL fold metallo-hydrolase [Balneolales bacterium]